MISKANRVVSAQERREVEQRAKDGDASAQIYLAWAHLRDGPYGDDAAQTEHWLRQAAQSGSLEGLRRLARFLYDNERDEASHVVAKLIQQGDFYGHYLRGHMLMHGDCGVRVDPHKAVEHWTTAANSGHLISEIDLAKHLQPLFYLYPLKVIKIASLMARIFWLLLRDPTNLAIFR